MSVFDCKEISKAGRFFGSVLCWKLEKEIEIAARGSRKLCMCS